MREVEDGRICKALNIAIPVVAIIGALYHLISTQHLFQTFLEHQNNHFAFALILVCLTSLKKKPKHWPFILPLMLLGVVATGYVKVFFTDLQGRIGFPTTIDIVIGILLVIVALEASRRAFGPAISALAIIFIAYDLLGQYLPPPFYHCQFTLQYVVTHLSIGLCGMYGTALAVSVNYIFLFFLFGGILQASQAMEFFLALGKLVGRKLRGGAAQTAVVSSALVGSVTGSAVANVAITGAFTIPLMKKVGYRPEQAGAIEAAASTGGQILPPVMGAAAFLMSGITGIPYIQIVLAAIIPALLYFIAVGLYVEFQARSLNITKLYEEIDIRGMLVRMPCFVVPLAMLIGLLVRGYTPMFCAFWAIIALITTSFITDFLTKERSSLRQLLKGFTSRLLKGVTAGATGGAQIGVTSAVLGFLMGSLTMTGIGIKLSGMVEQWSMGILLIACVLTMCISILFGMGVPTMVAYALVAVIVTPVLMHMGVPLLQAHFFCMFFAVFSGITPPVALSALAGSAIAGGKYFKTGLTAFKICIVAFVLPYLIIWNPALIMQPQSLLVGINSVIAVVLALMATAIVVTNYYIVKPNVWQRALFAICAVLLLAYAFTINHVLLVAGIILLTLLTLYQLRERRLRGGHDGLTNVEGG